MLLQQTLTKLHVLTGAFAQSVDTSLVATQFADINALAASQVQATGVIYVAFTTVAIFAASIDTTVGHVLKVHCPSLSLPPVCRKQIQLFQVNS